MLAPLLVSTRSAEPPAPDRPWRSLARDQCVVRGPWIGKSCMACSSILWTASENAQDRSPPGSRRTGKVLTSVSPASTCTGATFDDAAAKVMPPQEISIRNPHEEVMSSGSIIMASLVLMPAVSSSANQREPTEADCKVRPVGTVVV